MADKNRLTRINESVQREVANIIRGELEDPRIPAVVSVVKVETTRDLKFCKIHVSAPGGEDERKVALEGIRSAAGLIRKLVAERVNLRVTPELTFLADDSMEYGMRISKLIDEVNRHE